jgi:subtilisin family serine protease
MRRTRGVLLLIAGALATVLVTGATAQPARQSDGISAHATTSSKRYARVLGASNYTDFRPAALERTGPVRVLVALEGASVAERKANAERAGSTLSESQRSSIRSDLRRQQEALAARIAALGGQVIFAYQDAVNGLSVTIDAKKVSQLAALPGVENVRPARIVKPDNTQAAQYVNAPQVWNGPSGFTGEGVTIAVIDTGVDYTHANFGGPGTEAAYDDADARDTTLEGDEFNEKVVGGYDFVGDDYDAEADDPGDQVPHPDPDPLDCDGHGSHVGGTAAGYGVVGGTTYTGPYGPGIYATTVFTIGPGIAPEATIRAYRVFGCGGSATADVIVAAINRAVADGVDVINMSLGSPFGRNDDMDSVATNNAVQAGVVVVASSGNSGPAAYITGSPGAADRAISVAALDASRAQMPGALINLPGGGSIPAINANEAPLPSGPMQVKVLRNPDGTVSLGCDPEEYVDVAGKLVVTLRGSCARVARAVFGEKAGAAAVVMINTSTAFPPFEGPIEGNPDTGEEFLVTIPFLGVRGLLGPDPEEDPDRLVAADGQTVTLSPSTVDNPGYQIMASFTSGGPRNVDSFQKPDVTAPGVSVFSTNEDSGARGAYNSGTSMAAPVVSGVAALMVQARPTWSPEAIKGAIMNTAEAGPSKIASGYNTRLAGTGVVQADRSVGTVAYTSTTGGRNTLSYGYEPLSGPLSESHPLTIHNTSGAAVTFDLSLEPNGNQRGADVTFSQDPVSVPAGGSTTVQVTVALSAEDVAALPPAVASNFGSLVHTVRGVVIATPTTTGAGLMPLRVPYMLVPRGLSNVEATGATRGFRPTVQVRNTGIHSGTADPFVWAIEDPSDVPHPEKSTDVRAAGLQIVPREALCGSDPVGVCGTRNDRGLIFAINVWGYYSNPSVSEFDIAIDVDQDGEPDRFVVGVDLGAILAGSFDGRFASFVFDAEGTLINAWVAEAPMNGSTMLLPALASDLGIASNGRQLPTRELTFQVESFSIIPEDDGDENTPDNELLQDVTSPATLQYASLLGSSSFPGASSPVVVPPGGTASVPVPAGFFGSSTGGLGWMIVTHDDANGAPQADLVPAR